MTPPSAPPPPRRSGVWMFLFGLGLALTTTAYFFQYVLDRQYNPNTRAALAKQTGELRLKQNRGGHYLAEGRIRDVPVTFLLDTGATRVVVSEKIARRAGLRAHGEGWAQTASGIVKTRLATIDDLQVGPLLFSDVRGAIIESPGDEELALLGMSALEHLEMIQRGDTLILRPPAADE